MIDLENESPLTIPAAARTVPNRNGGRGVNVSTVWRWTLRGCRGVKLGTVLCGGIRYTSREALERFFAATTAAADRNSRPAPSTSSQRERAILAAEAELEAAGI